MADELIERTQNLLKELELFKTHLEQQRKLGRVEYRHFERDARNELHALQQTIEENEQEKIRHAIRCSNLPYLHSIWDAAKRARDVVGLKRHSSLMEVEAEGGLLWIRLYNITEKRLLLDMAKEGWPWEQVSDSDDDTSRSRSDDEPFQFPLFKVAVNIAREAKRAKVRYKHPRVRLVLPRINEGADQDIDLVLERMRDLGITVTCGNNIPPTPRVEDVLDQMVIDEFSTFTSTVNVDCTILLAFVSDMSNAEVSEESWFNYMIKKQLEQETKERLLPSYLWPATRGRKLVCTREAAKRMQEIVDEIGTESEKARARILLGDGEGRSREGLIRDFQALSVYKVPPDWELPIAIVEFDEAITKKLPPVAAAVEPRLTDINKSIFLYGWAMGITTVSSNKVTAKLIQNLIWDNRADGDDAEGPHIWLSPQSRSLVAKERDRKL